MRYCASNRMYGSGRPSRKAVSSGRGFTRHSGGWAPPLAGRDHRGLTSVNTGMGIHDRIVPAHMTFSSWRLPLLAGVAAALPGPSEAFSRGAWLTGIDQTLVRPAHRPSVRSAA